MIRRLIIACLAALALSACEGPDTGRASDQAVTPLLWEIASDDGEIEGWLYGTIHALPDGVEWRGGSVESVIASADYLVVEVAALEDRAALSRAFTRLAHSPGHPLLAERVDPALRDDLAGLMERAALDPDDYRTVESWGAALMLAQSVRGGLKSENGVDKALIRAFAGREVRQLEGAERQFRIFDSLAESDQRAMLDAVVQQAREEGNDAPRAARFWMEGDAEALEAETRQGILADPEVRSALLVRRNADWAGRIGRLLARQDRPLIAVGAAHLVGPDGLVALLEQQGLTLRRLR